MIAPASTSDSEISRRNAIKSIVRLAAAANLTLAAVASRASMAPAGIDDPMLASIRLLQHQMAEFEAMPVPPGLTLDEDIAFIEESAQATFEPVLETLRYETPVPTTMNGAIEAIRLLKRDFVDLGNYDDALIGGLLIAAVTFFDLHADA